MATELSSGFASNRLRELLIWVLRIVLGLTFALVGATKLTGTGHTVDYFAAIGWGQWFRYFTGILDVAGVVLLFVPRETYRGALLLACSVGMAAAISVTVLRGNPTWSGPAMVLVPLVMTMLAIVLAWLTRPLQLRRR